MLVQREWLSDLRESKKLTQKKLGQKVGVTRQAVAAWEDGTTNPSIITLYKLAAILGKEVHKGFAAEVFSKAS